MIVGVAQVILNVADLDAAQSALLDAGYERSFHEPALPSHPAKRAFQSVERQELAMAHFAAPDEAVAVELTSYAGAPPGGVPAYRLDGDGVVRMAAADLAASRRFWCDGLGFRGNGVLEFPALMPSWRMRLALEESDDGAPQTTIDADGCVLVTMLSTRIADDLERLAAEDGVTRSAGPWEEMVGGRPVQVGFVAGPSGELVELLEVRQGMRSEETR